MRNIKARTNPAQFRALTGLDIESFDFIMPYFEDAHDEYFRYHKVDGSRRTGQRRACIYKNSPLPSVAERLFFTLVFLKNNPLLQYHASMFDMTADQCGDWVHALTPILFNALRDAGTLPASTDSQLQAILSRAKDNPEISILLHDGTEREIPRPVDADEQKEKYSGKKKRHTVKNGIITTLAGIILFVGATVSGKTHDKAIADSQYTIPEQIILLQDSGYTGYRPGPNTYTPFKKPRGRELPEFKKEYNRKISSYRVPVEHYIGSAKIYRVAKEECRLRKNRFTDWILQTTAGLHNLRVHVKAPLNIDLKC